ncbi:MAG: hypothetical protein ACRDRV_11350 [Pseudonocardiaceae bacterium]
MSGDPVTGVLLPDHLGMRALPDVPSLAGRAVSNGGSEVGQIPLCAELVATLLPLVVSGHTAEGGLVMSAQRGERRLLAATCRVHGGTPGFTNLVVTREVGSGRIVLDPHVTRTCVIALDQPAARELHTVLGLWLA